MLGLRSVALRRVLCATGFARRATGAALGSRGAVWWPGSLVINSISNYSIGYAQWALKNGAAVAFSSTTAAVTPAAAAAAPGFQPSSVLVKVGDGSMYKVFHVPWAALSSMDNALLLEALIADDIFGPSLKDVELDKCSVAILKGKLPDEQEVPSADDEAEVGLLAVLGATPLGKAAQKAGCAGDRLFIRVRLPPTLLCPSESGHSAPVPLDAFFNVLTAPRDCSILKSHEKALLQLVSATSSEQARVAALSEVATALVAVHKIKSDTCFSVPLLETASHVDLVSELVSRAASLAAGQYVGINGAPCCTVIGARGIGKTTMLLAFTHACKAAFPSVIPLYVTAEDLGKRSSFSVMDLEDIMAAAARAHGVEVGAGGVNDALGASGHRMLLIVDEVDQLYQVDDKDPVLRKNVMNSLYTLCRLGDQRAGNFSVLLCGSAAATYSLVCGKVASVFHDTYPLLKSGVPDLNCTKFRELLIPSALCNDSKQVFGIVETLKLWPDASERERFKNARILTFLGGTTPRAVTSAIDVSRRGAVSAKLMGQLVIQQLRGERMLQAADNGVVRAFFETVLSLLVKVNEDLIKRLCPMNGSFQVEELVRVSDEKVLLDRVLAESCEEAAPAAIYGLQAGERELMPTADLSTAEQFAATSVPWEHLIRPVPRSAIVDEWRKLASAKERPFGDKHVVDNAYLEWLLATLSDASLLSVREGSTFWLERLVWPASAAQLVFYNKGSVESTVEKIMTFIHPIAEVVKVLQPLAAPVSAAVEFTAR